VATIDEINNWSGSRDVIGIAAQGDGVHSPVGMAGAIDGALPENNGSSVESAPGVYENSVGKATVVRASWATTTAAMGQNVTPMTPTTVLGRNVTNTTPTTERDRNVTQSVGDVVVTMRRTMMT